MASPTVVPFIPPSSVPERSPAAPQPAVIPSPPGSGVSMPSWAHTPQNPANYPIYPSTPYTGPGYIPLHGTPAVAPGQLPGPYMPNPLTGPVFPQGPQPPGVSLDYTGYPSFANPSTPWGAPHPPLHPHSPWHPVSAPLHPAAPPWNAYRQPNPNFNPNFPQQAGVFPGGGPPPGMGLAGFTPGPGMIFDPSAGASHAAPPTWFQQQAPPAPPQMQLPQHLQPGSLGRATANINDGVDKFAAGNHYGPVLEPFIIRVVRAKIIINPLLQPPPDDGSDRPHLQWNMVYTSAQCRKSTDERHVSWHSGRDEPATFPRVTFLRIVSPLFPWTFGIRAKNPKVGVTCGDVVDALAENFMLLSSAEDFAVLPGRRQNHIAEAYRHNRSTAFGVPGGMLGEGMRRFDFLCKDTMYGGIVEDEALLRRLCGDVIPCTFVLNCLRRYALTQDEIRDQEERDRMIAEAEKKNSRRATVETDSEEEDDD